MESGDTHEDISMAILGLNSVLKVSLFSSYVLMWTAQSILVHYANLSGKIYNATTAVFLQDTCKLIITVILFNFQDGNMADMIKEVCKNKTLFILYFVPAGLYAVYNNLTFVCLSVFDPASYAVLLQFKIVVTAMLSITFLGVSVSSTQWIALTVIMFGTMLKECDGLFNGVFNHGVPDYVLIFLQLMLSSLAGVYTEKLLKGKGSASPNVQNLFMYSNSMICNFLGLMIKSSGNHQSLFSPFYWQNLKNIFTEPVLILIILIAACTGVVVGFFLKYLGNILKTIAAAIELWTAAIFSSIIFGYPIDIYSLFALVFVSMGVWLYSKGSSSASSSSSQVKYEQLPIEEQSNNQTVRVSDIDSK